MGFSSHPLKEKKEEKKWCEGDSELLEGNKIKQRREGIRLSLFLQPELVMSLFVSCPNPLSSTASKAAHRTHTHICIHLILPGNAVYSRSLDCCVTAQACVLLLLVQLFNCTLFIPQIQSWCPSVTTRLTLSGADQLKMFHLHWWSLGLRLVDFSLSKHTEKRGKRRIEFLVMCEISQSLRCHMNTHSLLYTHVLYVLHCLVSYSWGLTVLLLYCSLYFRYLGWINSISPYGFMCGHYSTA